MESFTATSPTESGQGDGFEGPLLEVCGLDVSYGSMQILFGVDLEVHPGEILALLGTNGAGKSTLLRAVSGLLSPSQGEIRFRGEDLGRVSAVDRVRRGIVQVPGGKALFPDLSVDENLRIGGYTMRRDPARLDGRIAHVLEWFPALTLRRSQRAGSLSGGERQMLAIAKGLLIEPTLLCIDELSLGLAPKVVGELLEIVQGLRVTGTTIVIVEQSVNIALGVADRAIFLEKGHVRFEGVAHDLLDRGDLVRAVFLGGAR